MRMKDGESLDQLAGRIAGMAVRYSNLGGTLENAALVKKLLDSVPVRFIHCIAGMEQFCDLKTMQFEEAVGRLKAYDERTRGVSAGGGGGAAGDGHLLLADGQHKKEGGESSGKQSGSDGGGRGRGRGYRGRGHGRGGRGEHQGGRNTGGKP
ncbi:glycine-rich RNA-binding protein 8-like [Panicum virgatum]|uniref:glycine-rich RNA-binding protein 8-like n=1 Tax=Panicum virgatum TaxID=38727 RepID=UPI0019D5226E|nr:glycine-rich RNA-binding protein 8-like [Panicum virgatum]